MSKQFYFSLVFLLISSGVFSQKKEQTVLRLSTVTKTASAVETTAGKRIKGHDVYTFTLTANENGTIHLPSCYFWIKDLTTLPVYFQKDPKLKGIKFKKGEVITLVAEAKGINPYQKPPKKINGFGLISCLINNEKAYIEVRSIPEQ